MDAQQYQCCTSFDLSNVLTNTLCTQILCSFNVDSNFEYTPIMNNKHVLYGGLDNIPNFIPRTKLYLIVDLELVLIMNTPGLTILNDLIELLSNRVKIFPFSLSTALLVLLETDLNPIHSFPLKNFKIFPLSSPGTNNQIAITLMSY
jgi:hypothetical protein